MVRKLAWRCRRGTRELDQLLSGYLKTAYLNAAHAEQQQFQQLLELSDSELWQLLFIKNNADSQGLHHLVEKIRHNANIFPA